MPVTVSKASSAPPSKATANKSTAKGTTAPTVSDVTTARADAVKALGQFAQMPLMFTRQYADVGTISLHWPKVSEEIAKLAASNEQVARIVDPLMTVGPYAGLIMAVMPMFAQIAVNHGRAPVGVAGSVPPVALSSQVEAEMARNELQALTIQRDAEMQAAAMRKEIDDQRRQIEAENAQS